MRSAPWGVFDEVELGIVTENGLVPVKLVESWVELGNDIPEADTDEAETPVPDAEADKALAEDTAEETVHEMPAEDETQDDSDDIEADKAASEAIEQIEHEEAPAEDTEEEAAREISVEDEAPAEAGEAEGDEPSAEAEETEQGETSTEADEIELAAEEAAAFTDASEGLTYTFGEEKTVYVSELLEQAEITLSAYYYSVSVSDHGAVKLEAEFDPYDCAVTALNWFDAVSLTVSNARERFVFELRNPEPGDRRAAGEVMASEDGKGSVVFADDVVLPEGTSLTVDAVQPEFDEATQADIDEKLSQVMGDGAVDVHWFDISLGDVHDVGATVTVENVLDAMPAGDVRPVIIHITDAGDVVIIEDVQIDENGSVTFATEGFSTFGLAVPQAAGVNLLAAAGENVPVLTLGVKTSDLMYKDEERYMLFTPEYGHEYTFTLGNLGSVNSYGTKTFRIVDEDGNQIATKSSTQTADTWTVYLDGGKTYRFTYKRTGGLKHKHKNHRCYALPRRAQLSERHAGMFLRARKAMVYRRHEAGHSQQ